MVANAQKEYEMQVETANKTYGDTLAIIQQKYLEYDEEGRKHLERIAQINEELNQLETKRLSILTGKLKRKTIKI